MTKAVFVTAAWVCFSIATSATASPLVVRCSAETQWGDKSITVQVNISMPRKMDQFIFISNRGGDGVEIPDGTPVGVGAIEITEILGTAKESHRHQFIVTRMPSENNSLVGFYLTNSYVNSIRAELWQKKKPFTYFDTYNNEVLHGQCQ